MTTYKQWMTEVDRIIEDMLGFDSSHLRDRNWGDLFRDGSAPLDAVEIEFGSATNPEIMMETELYG